MAGAAATKVEKKEKDWWWNHALWEVEQACQQEENNPGNRRIDSPNVLISSQLYMENKSIY